MVAAAECLTVFLSHAPCVGSDEVSPYVVPRYSMFLSTLPVWGATRHFPLVQCEGTCFYPRSLCGERRR
jgi:hypothetical protein